MEKEKIKELYGTNILSYMIVLLEEENIENPLIKHILVQMNVTNILWDDIDSNGNPKIRFKVVTPVFSYEDKPEFDTNIYECYVSDNGVYPNNKLSDFKVY